MSSSNNNSSKTSSSSSSSSSSPITQCSDGHRCMSGSTCVQNPVDEGQYYCNCSSKYNDDLYAGVSCEYKATQYCVSANMPPWFCTNEGSCITVRNPNNGNL